MHRIRMIAPDDLRVLLLWLQRLGAPLARRGVCLFIEVDDPEQPSYVDVRLDGSEAAAQSLALLLSRYLCGQWQYAFIRQHLQNQHGYLSPDEVEYLLIDAFHQCTEERSKEFSRVLVKQVGAMLVETGEVHVDGVLRFRCTKYLHDLLEMVDGRVDQYLLSREYEEFVGVLRYFLDTTPTTDERVHVVVVGEAVLGLDDAGGLLDVTRMEAIAKEAADEELHPQDVLMSALITRSPAKITIHSTNRDEQFVKTLLRVFGERADLCEKDPDCDMFLSKVDNVRRTIYI